MGLFPFCMSPSTSAALSADRSIQYPTFFHIYIYFIDKVYYTYLLANKVTVLNFSSYPPPSCRIVSAFHSTSCASWTESKFLVDSFCSYSRNPHWAAQDNRRICSTVSPQFLLGGVLWRLWMSPPTSAVLSTDKSIQDCTVFHVYIY